MQRYGMLSRRDAAPGGSGPRTRWPVPPPRCCSRYRTRASRCSGSGTAAPQARHAARDHRGGPDQRQRLHEPRAVDAPIDHVLRSQVREERASGLRRRGWRRGLRREPREPLVLAVEVLRQVVELEPAQCSRTPRRGWSCPTTPVASMPGIRDVEHVVRHQLAPQGDHQAGDTQVGRRGRVLALGSLDVRLQRELRDPRVPGAWGP